MYSGVRVNDDVALSVVCIQGLELMMVKLHLLYVFRGELMMV